jgi:hypothetical protein
MQNLSTDLQKDYLFDEAQPVGQGGKDQIVLGKSLVLFKGHG